MENQQSVIKYWITAARNDFSTAQILFDKKRYTHALFFCHLSIEKSLKAKIVKHTDSAPPFVHDLIRLAETAGLSLDETFRDDLAEINAFNIVARYDDYKMGFAKKADKKFTGKYLEKTKEILKWLTSR